MLTRVGHVIARACVDADPFEHQQATTTGIGLEHDAPRHECELLVRGRDVQRPVGLEHDLENAFAVARLHITDDAHAITNRRHEGQALHLGPKVYLVSV